MSYGCDYKFIPTTSITSGVGISVLPDIYCYTIHIVNICFVKNLETKEFILIDAGMPNSANEIIGVAEKRFGDDSRPIAILLTHGHFDHVGAFLN